MCSGIEAPTVALEPLGWKPVFFSEIEPFACAVLKHRYPDVPNYGDMTRYKEWPDATLDVLIAGTPCQDFSVAGLREGIDAPRGNLTLTFLGVIERYRPERVLWENVPGVLSSDGGRALGAFLGGLAQLGYGFSYRVLDAQFFGVPQRRERVFVVGHSRGRWQRSAAVLFERESLSRNPPPSREAREDVAGTVTAGFGRRRGCGIEPAQLAVAGTLGAGKKSAGTAITQDAQQGLLIPTTTAYGGNNTAGAIEVATAVRAHPSPHYDFESETFVAHTLQASHDASADGGGRGTPLVPVTHGSSTDRGTRIATATSVRRIMPIEAERLQGFPDGYTRIPYRGGLAKDGPRYRALGNSMAVPVIRWIGERMDLIERLASE